MTLGCYHLRARVGEGGTAKVFRAEAPGHGEVAVKVLAARLAKDETVVRRFEREADLLASLRHPGLVPLLDRGVDPVLGPYLVTPLLRGPTLGELARRSGAMLPEAAVALVLQLLEPLAALHRVGLVHRDVKPDNVVATDEGRLVLVDLGLAVGAEHARFTASGVVAGTVPYMAPEQLRGERRITAATDLWQVGVMLYELVAGRRPFKRSNEAEELAAILMADAPSLSAVDRRCPEALASVVARCLDRDPARRPRDADALRGELLVLVDWTSPAELDRDVAELLAYPAAWRERVATVRVARLRAEAALGFETGGAFRAIRSLDRALAYRPRDATTLELVDRAASLAGGRPFDLPPSEAETVRIRPV